MTISKPVSSSSSNGSLEVDDDDDDDDVDEKDMIEKYRCKVVSVRGFRNNRPSHQSSHVIK
jgi:3-oxoacyl-ACP reductase-like protein